MNWHTRRTQELAPLQPLPQAVGLFSNFIPHQTQTIAIKEKVLSFTDTFYLEDAYTKQAIMKCEGKFLTMRKKKVLYAMNGQPLYCLKEKLLSFPPGFTGYSSDESHEIFSCKSRISITGTNMHLVFTDSFSGSPMELELRGSFFERKATITLNGQPVAYITRSFMNARQLIMDNNSFYVSIAPGCDIALIIGFVLCLADREERKN